MAPRVVRTETAPAAVGPYSQGVVAGNLLFTAMQIALDPATGDLVGATAPEQAERCLENIRAIVQAAGASLATVAKVTVYLTDLTQFAAVNEAYARFFPEAPPARAVVEVSALPLGALVAVEAVAEI